jgi:hypothetical protein
MRRRRGGGDEGSDGRAVLRWDRLGGCCYPSVMACKDVGKLGKRSLVQLEKDGASVGGVRCASDPFAAFEAIDEDRDPARAERQPLPEFTLGQRSIELEMLQRV